MTESVESVFLETEGSFHPITTFITGTDVIPSLTQVYEMPPLSKPLQTTPPTGNDDSSNTAGHVAQIRLPVSLEFYSFSQFGDFSVG